MSTTDEETIKCADDLTILISDQEASGKNMYDYLRTDYLKSIDGKVEAKGAIIVAIMGYTYVNYLFYSGSLQNPVATQKNAFYTAVKVGAEVMKNINTDLNWMGASYTVISNLSTVIKNLEVTKDGIKENMNQLNAPVEDFDNINDESVNEILEGINDSFPFISITVGGLNAGGDKSENGSYKVNTQTLLSALFGKLTISSDSEVNIDPDAEINIDSDSLVTIDGGTLSISGADSALTMESAKIIIENGGGVTLTEGQLVNYGDTIEVNGADSSLIISEGELINSDSCSIIINGGPLDIEGENFTNNDHVMYVPEEKIEGFIKFDVSAGKYKLCGLTEGFPTLIEQQIDYADWNGGWLVYNQNHFAFMYFETGRVRIRDYTSGAVVETTIVLPDSVLPQAKDAYFDDNGDLNWAVLLKNDDLTICKIIVGKNGDVISTTDFANDIQNTKSNYVNDVITDINAKMLNYSYYQNNTITFGSTYNFSSVWEEKALDPRSGLYYVTEFTNTFTGTITTSAPTIDFTMTGMDCYIDSIDLFGKSLKLILSTPTFRSTYHAAVGNGYSYEEQTVDGLIAECTSIFTGSIFIDFNESLSEYISGPGACDKLIGPETFYGYTPIGLASPYRSYVIVSSEGVTINKSSWGVIGSLFVDSIKASFPGYTPTAINFPSASSVDVEYLGVLLGHMDDVSYINSSTIVLGGGVATIREQEQESGSPIITLTVNGTNYDMSDKMSSINFSQPPIVAYKNGTIVFLSTTGNSLYRILQTDGSITNVPLGYLYNLQFPVIEISKGKFNSLFEW